MCKHIIRQCSLETSASDKLFCVDLRCSNQNYFQVAIRSRWWLSGWSRRLSDLKCTVMIWRSWVWTPVSSNLECIVLLSYVVLESEISPRVKSWLSSMFLLYVFGATHSISVLAVILWGVFAKISLYKCLISGEDKPTCKIMISSCIFVIWIWHGWHKLFSVAIMISYNLAQSYIQGTKCIYVSMAGDHTVQNSQHWPSVVTEVLFNMLNKFNLQKELLYCSYWRSRCLL